MTAFILLSLSPAATAMKITQFVMLILSLLLVNADEYCDNVIKNFHKFWRKCPIQSLTFSDCCDIRVVSTVSGIYKLSTKTFITDDIYCDMTTDGGGWIVVQRNKKDSLVDFNKNWTDYEKGFGDLNTEFWYGLVAIHCLTDMGQWEMRIDYQTSDKKWSYHHYSQFSVGPGKSEYPLSLGGFTGAGTDWFSSYTSLYGRRFTTLDNDNDGKYGNCADSDKSGWWYNYCRRININMQPPYVYGRVVVFSEMKIRPKNCIFS